MAAKSEALDQFEQQFAKASEAGLAARSKGKFARSARYDAKDKRLHIELASGSAIAIPVALIEGLADASEEVRRTVQLAGGGSALFWRGIDLTLSVPNLVGDIFGTGEWMTSVMSHLGSKRSAAKAAAARSNGRLGGRPKATRMPKAA